MKPAGFFTAAALSLALSATLPAQNTTGGGSGQPGFENERKVVLRVRFGYAAQPNPGIYEYGGGSTPQEAAAQSFGETRYWLSSVAQASWAEEQYSAGEEHRTTIFVDPVKRSFRQNGDVGIHYQSYHGKYLTRETEEGATFKNPRSVTSDHAELGGILSGWYWSGTHKWATRTSAYFGGGREFNLGNPEFPETALEADYSVDPITGAGEWIGDDPVTNLWEYYSRAWNGHGTQVGIGSYRNAPGGVFGGSSRKYSNPYTSSMFFQDTASLRPPVPEVVLPADSLGRVTQAVIDVERASTFYSRESNSVFYPMFLDLVSHARSWTAKQWHDESRIWIGQKFMHPDLRDAASSSAVYWLESNDCEPFEFTWIEAAAPMISPGFYNPETGSIAGTPEYSTRTPVVTVQRVTLGRGFQKSRPFRVTQGLTAPNSDYFLRRVEIIPNFDRDETIDLAGHTDRGRASHGTPWRWWINDDSDVGDIADDESDIPGAETGTMEMDGRDPNYGDNRVNWRCDVVDFFPLFFDIKPLLDTLPPSDEIKYKLRHEHEALNFVYTNLTPDQADDYLVENLTTGFGSGFDKPPQDADTIKVTSAGVELNPAFLDKIKDEGRGILLFEGRKATDRPLVLEISKGGIKLAEVKFYLKISKVQAMYRWINLRAAADGDVEDGTNTGTPDNYPNALCSKNHFIYAHGYNVSEEHARGECAEIFKRLHQLGSRARFVGVAWRGDHSQIPFTGKTPDFHENVNNAFKTASAARAAIAGLSGEKIVAAHSLGNMLLSAAMTLDSNPLSVSKYFMIDAAVALEAFDAGARNIDEMREPDWQPYVDQNSPGRDPRRLWASEWHQLFPDGDGRRKLTWRGRFLPFANAINFYSTGEDVLQNGDGTKPPVTVETFTTGLLAWVTQEMAKGTNDAELLTGVSHGGWGFNTAYGEVIAPPPSGVPYHVKMPPPDAFGLSDETLRLDSFFKRFEAYQLYHPTQGNAAANDYAIRSKALSEALPALSFATGANPLDPFNSAGDDRNIDMMTLRPNGWPEERSGDPRWRHSDFREVAFYYTYQLYREFVVKGDLK